MLTICTTLESFEKIKLIIKKYKNIYGTFGIHPHESDKHKNVDLQFILNVKKKYKKIIGIGETGLDYFYDNSPREAQRESFCAHIEVARRTGLPVIIHSRSADEDTAAIIRAEHEKGPFPGLIHCFSAGQSVASSALECGLSISLSGIATFKNAHSLRSIVQELPLDRLLIETDAPFLAPVPRRGMRNEPSFVSYTADFLAKFLAIEIEQFAKRTTDNFFELFTRARRPT